MEGRINDWRSRRHCLLLSSLFHLESAVILGLRARGADLATTCKAGRLATSDESQLAFATEVGRVIYTFNASDFASASGVSGERTCPCRYCRHSGTTLFDR